MPKSSTQCIYPERRAESLQMLQMGTRDQPRETVLRTFRLDKDIVAGLEDVAHEKHTSPNNLVNLLLRDYLEWGFYYETRGSLWISKRTFRTFLEHLPEKDLQTIAKDLHTNAKEMSLLRSGRWDLESYLQLATASKYSAGTRTEIKHDEDYYTLIMHHDLGPKYSAYVKAYHEAILSQFTDGLQTEVSDGTVVFRFRAEAKAAPPAR